MATKKVIKKPLHVDGLCQFELPIDHLGDSVDKSERVASYASAMASMVPRFPSLTFTVTADGIEATVDACVLVNDVSLEALIRGILEAGDEQHRAYMAWRKGQEKPKAKAKAKAA